MAKETDDQASSPDHSTTSHQTSGQGPSTDLSFYARDLPGQALSELRVIRDEDGVGYLQVGNETTVTRVDSPHAQAIVLRCAAKAGCPLRPHEVREVMSSLKIYAPLTPHVFPVWHRVAPIEGGIEIDVGDKEHRRIQVTHERVQIVARESSTFFYRPTTMRSFVIPAEEGDFGLLDNYLNLAAPERLLLRAWIGYVLAHAKVSTASFPILVLNGDQGSGKTVLCRLVQSLVDPGTVGVRTFPHSARDLAIAAEQTRLLMFDNVREIRPAMADALCIGATGGSLATRKLYTDSEMVNLKLHVAVIVNGIHDFIDQADLAQRSLPITLLPLDEGRLRSETALMQQFQRDLPSIFRGLLNNISEVLAQIPLVEPANPERMVDFSHWLAAMERVDGVHAGVYQRQYSSAIDEGMRCSLLEHPLAAAVLDLLDHETSGRWSGTPSALFETLARTVSRRTAYSREWPPNAIAMSKRLKSIQAGLRRQGVDVLLSRSRERQISISRLGGATHE